MKRYIIAACAALALSLATLSAPAQAQEKKMEGGKMESGKMQGSKMAAPAMKGPVYVCADCKMGYSPADAKKMGYKDPMGHKLVKMDKMPSGYAMGGGKMGDKMGGKMGGDKMGGAKMGSGVYVCPECKMYFTPAEAKKMGFKDPMGHKMTMKPSAPAGYTSGSKMSPSKMNPGDKMKPKM